jgi:2-polyprenyl-3-methyl-5-hydroxy-6-metoxy-1,4-benzoquinol methylase
LPVQKPNFRNYLRHAHTSLEIQFAPSAADLMRPMRFAIARRFLQLAFRTLRPRRLYEPVEIGGRRFSHKRDAEARWNAIAGAIRQYDAHSILDVGCAEAWFLRRAAAEFGCFAIGVEATNRRVLLGEIARLHDGAERVAVLKAKLAPDDIRYLPACDIVLCLSVVHHVMREGGRNAAEEFVRALANCVGKALLFEMGTSEERELAWTKTLPDMPEGQESFVRALLNSAGFTNIQVVAETSGLKGDAQRLLFAAEPKKQNGL